MLDPSEARAVADLFGVSAEQVARDHLISHLLAAISTYAAEAVIFFGGTALARTLLPDNRLSEDIDPIARDSRRDVATLLDDALPRALRREFPGSTWDPALSEVAGPAPALFRTPDGLAVRVQLLSPIGYPPWPTAFTELAQRYIDAPPATLWVPTAPAFTASKSTAWYDRAASRDLYDLWALAEHGHITIGCPDVRPAWPDRPAALTQPVPKTATRGPMATRPRQPNPPHHHRRTRARHRPRSMGSDVLVAESNDPGVHRSHDGV